MIPLDAIKNFFPPHIRDNAVFAKFMLKEYLQLLILDHLSTTAYIRKVCFIGGTSLRLTKGIDRFSEDLDFDCKDFSRDDFDLMTNGVLLFLQRQGLTVVAKDKPKAALKAFRRSLYFPGLLYDLGISGHRDERFLIKIESEDQLVHYEPQLKNVKGCGFYFPMTVPPDGVLCAMKIAAMLERQKGRDFYDVMFLLSQTTPDYAFLAEKCGIDDHEMLQKEAEKVFKTVDLQAKMKDFEHLLFNKQNSARILRVASFFKELGNQYY